jgi:hypothetical protein
MRVEDAASARQEIESVGDSLKKLNDSSFQKLSGQVTAIHSKLGSLRESLTSLAQISVAGFTIGAFAEMIRGAIDAADSLNDLKKSTGIAVADLAGLKLAAAQSGGDLEGIAASINKLSVAMGKDAERFARLGVTAKDPIEAFKQLADVFSAIDDPQTRAALGAEALGKSWASSAPLLMEGSKNIGEMVEKGKALSRTTQEMADKADEFNDKLAELQTAASGAKMKLAGEMLPAMTEITKAVTTAYEESGKLQALWVAMGALGKFAFTDEFSSAEVKLKNLRGELEHILRDQALAKDAPAVGFVGRWLFGDSEEALTRRVTELRAQISGLEKQMTAPPKAEGADQAAKDAAAAKAAKDKAAEFLRLNEEARKAAEAEAKKAQETYAGLTAAVNAKIAATAQEAAGLGKLSEAQKLQVDLDEQLRAGKLKLTPQNKAAYEQLIGQLAVNEQVVASQKRAVAGAEAMAKITKELQDDRAKSLETAVKEAEQNEELARTFGLSKAAIEAQEVARLEEQLAQRASTAMTLDEIEALEQLIAVKKRSAAALGEVEAKEAYKKSADDMVAEYKRASEQIGQSLTDNIMRGGKSAAEYVQDLFRTMVLRPVLSPIGNAVGGMLTSAFSPGTAQGSTGAAGSSNLIGAAQNASSLYSMGKTMYAGFSAGLSSSMGSIVTSFGSMFGSQAATAYGVGMSTPGAAAVMAELSGGAAGATAGTATAASGAAGASAGAYAIPIAGWIAAGMALSHSLYSQGWDARNGTLEDPLKLSGGSMAFDSILRGIGLSNSAANIFSGQATYARLLGRKNPEVESQFLQGTVNSAGLDGHLLSNIVEKGGLFRSDKRYPQTSDLSVAQDAGFDATIQAMLIAVKGFGEALGAQVDQIDGYTKAINLQLTSDDAKNQELITKLFGDIGDELSTRLVPDLAKFSKTGETASITLQRLASDFQATDQMAQLLGTSARALFGGKGMESAAAREQLIALAGGVQVLGQQAGFYAQNFLTDAQRLAPVEEALGAAMADLGLSSITTRVQFKDHIDQLVASGKILTEAGAKEFTSMMKLEEAFALVHPQIDATTDALAKQAAAQQQMKDAASGLLGGVDDAFSVLQKVVGREKAALQQRIDAETEVVGKLTSLSDSLHGTIDGMRAAGQDGAARAAAQAQIRAALAAAKAGGALPSADSLKSALALAGQSDPRKFSSYQDYLSDFNRTRNDIAQLAGITDNSLSVEQESLDALNQQAKSLDGVLDSAQSQIDVLKGQSTTLLSIDQAMRGLASAILAAQANPMVASGAAINQAYAGALGRAPDAAGMAYWQQQAANGVSTSSIVGAINNSTEAKVQALYQSLLGHSADAPGLQFWLSGGASLDAIGAGIKNSAEYQKLHPFAAGANIIPEDMPALLHAGERVVPAADNRELMRRLADPAAGNAVLVAEVRLLREQAARTQEVLDRIAASTGQHANQFNDVTGGGAYLRTKAVGK